jgi:hypothetical protein
LRTLVLVQSTVTTFTSGAEDRVVCNGGSESSTGSLGEGVGGTTTYNEGTSDGGKYDSGYDTSGDTSYGTNRESTKTGALDVATIFGNVTSRDGTVVSSRADDIEEFTSADWITFVGVALVGWVANLWGVDARLSRVGGVFITGVDCARVVILTEVDW